MPEISKAKYSEFIGWKDCPHLSPEACEIMANDIEPHLRKSRMDGLPSLGSGAIYPIEREEVECEPFEIPAYWPVLYSLDVGWKKTAALWGSWDQDSDIVYIWSEHYRGEVEPVIHASAIKARGDWIQGVIDTAARGRSQIDGHNLMDIYTDEGLMLHNANKAVDAGLLQVYQRLSTGRLKIFGTLRNFWAEYVLYRRNDNGKIVKEMDHLMDCLRYFIMGLEHASLPPVDLGSVYRDDTHDDNSGY